MRNTEFIQPSKPEKDRAGGPWGVRFPCSTECSAENGPDKSGQIQPTTSRHSHEKSGAGNELALARFMSKTAPGEGGCLNWTACVQSRGYGCFSVDTNKSKLAHRWIYETTVGPIPAGLTIDHLCRNRRCVNVAHMEPVPMAENNRRGNSATALNGRRTHCKNGHPFDAENTYVKKNGSRQCRACSRGFNRAWHRKHNPIVQAVRKAKPDPEVRITPPARAVSLVSP